MQEGNRKFKYETRKKKYIIYEVDYNKDGEGKLELIAQPKRVNKEECNIK